MDFKIEFIQICFRGSADFIQPSFLLFSDVVIGWSLSMNRALLFLFSIYIADLYACTIYIGELYACTIYIAELCACMILHCGFIWLFGFESCPVSSCSRS